MVRALPHDFRRSNLLKFSKIFCDISFEIQAQLPKFHKRLLKHIFSKFQQKLGECIFKTLSKGNKKAKNRTSTSSKSQKSALTSIEIALNDLITHLCFSLFYIFKYISIYLYISIYISIYKHIF